MRREAGGGKIPCPGEVARELQPLRLAPGKRRHRLAEPHVLQAHVHQRLQTCNDFRAVGEKYRRFRDRHLQYVRDRLALDGQLQHLGAETLAVAVGTTQVDVGKELHLHVFEAVAAAGRAAAVARVKAEGAGGIAALLCRRLLCVKIADRIPGTHVARRVGASSASYRALVHHHHFRNAFVPTNFPVRAGQLGRLALVLQQRRIKHVLDQRGLAGPADAGDADQAIERNLDVDVL